MITHAFGFVQFDTEEDFNAQVSNLDGALYYVGDHIKRPNSFPPCMNTIRRGIHISAGTGNCVRIARLCLRLWQNAWKIYKNYEKKSQKLLTASRICDILIS